MIVLLPVSEANRKEGDLVANLGQGHSELSEYIL
jgi:hypothetical protein